MDDGAFLGLEDEHFASGEVHDGASVDFAVVHECHGFAEHIVSFLPLFKCFCVVLVDGFG